MERFASWYGEIWLLKIAYVCKSSSVSGRYLDPMDVGVLENASHLILNTHFSESQWEKSLGPMLTIIGAPFHTVFYFLSGTVLRDAQIAVLPISSTAVLFDFIDHINAYLRSTSLAHIPIYFISPSAHASLMYANIQSEWMSQTLQSRVNQAATPLQLPTNFKYAASIEDLLLKCGLISSVPAQGSACESAPITQFQRLMLKPCVLICEHASLLMGEAYQWLAWRGGRVILTGGRW